MTPELHPDFLQHIASINWFYRCGEHDDLMISIPHQFVNSWTIAQKFYQQSEWENMGLLGQNSVTGYLYDNYLQLLTDYWNPIAEETREFVLNTVTPTAKEFAESHNLHPDFINCVQWDILHCIMEDAFRDTNLPVCYFSELLKVYEKGHFPCGWVDGDWYSGKLVVI